MHEITFEVKWLADNHVELVPYLKGTRTEVTAEEILDWFTNDDLLEVAVKLKPEYMGKMRPGFATVKDIKEVTIGSAKGKVIVLDDGSEVPSELFHQWYKLD